jgi:hypothetical protein
MVSLYLHLIHIVVVGDDVQHGTNNNVQSVFCANRATSYDEIKNNKPNQKKAPAGNNII